jgi:hypothetical protein
MSTTTVILLIAGGALYLGLVVFMLALCRVAGRADEAAERHPHVFVARVERFRRREDLERLDRRAAREVRGR